MTVVASDWGASLILSGELDLGGVDLLEAAVCEVERSSPLAVNVDLAQLWFADLVGARALARACCRLVEVTALVGIEEPPPSVVRLLELSGYPLCTGARPALS